MRITGPRWAVGRACNRGRYPGVLNAVARQISDEPGPCAERSYQMRSERTCVFATPISESCPPACVYHAG